MVVDDSRDRLSRAGLWHAAVACWAASRSSGLSDAGGLWRGLLPSNGRGDAKWNLHGSDCGDFRQHRTDDAAAGDCPIATCERPVMRSCRTKLRYTPCIPRHGCSHSCEIGVPNVQTLNRLLALKRFLAALARPADVLGLYGGAEKVPSTHNLCQ
jgi:hypothetical protein